MKCRYGLRVKDSKERCFLSFPEFNLKNILEDVSLQHYYDSKAPKRNVKYEVYDRKTKKAIWKEGD